MELQNQIQQHCMYLHNTMQLSNDTVQLDAPDYDPDIDSDNDIKYQHPKCPMVSSKETSQCQHNISEPLNASNLEPDTMQTRDNLPKTDWPDAPTVQIPHESSTTDQPPEVEYCERIAP